MLLPLELQIALKREKEKQELAASEAKLRELEELENQLMQIDGLDTSLKSLQFRQASEVTGDDKEATELDTMAGFVRMSEINEPAKKTDKPVTNKSKSLAI